MPRHGLSPGRHVDAQHLTHRYLQQVAVQVLLQPRCVGNHIVYGPAHLRSRTCTASLCFLQHARNTRKRCQCSTAELLNARGSCQIAMAQNPTPGLIPGTYLLILAQNVNAVHFL